ncbi:MAG: hypothetical protein GAK28_00109 [Luteibacter sp.]|uniref:sterol desaturase family protein n=1 Tax=Luteibacter sp. TaxID=1886636 RepID=UPI00137FC014|nr:sterol desaturase family protein [Luteibacter sp.]KAF1009471.1 MAG: hypothetical protein GAK28_00109 [Luteibacter sp.]
MHDLLISAWTGMRNYAWSVLLASTICLALEMLWPKSKYSVKSRLRGGLHWAVYIAITATSLAFFNALWAQLHITPLFTLRLGVLSYSEHKWLHPISWFGAPLLAGIIGEFFYYWFHRAQHTFKFMWRFHEVHHSLEEMSAWNSNHHFSEEIFRIPFITIPMSLLFALDTGLVPALIFTIIGMQGQYEHSCTRWNLGPLRYIVADNRYHRIHHSVHREQWGHNFGSFVPFWDIVFRTAIFPKKGEWPDVGVPGTPEPKTVRDFLFMPFRRRTGAENALTQQTLQPVSQAADSPAV